jgi:hypothetical protein
MSPLVKNIIIVLVVAGVGYFGYNYLTRTDTASDVLIQQNSADTSKMGAEVLAALNQLKTLKLDGSVFQDKTFLSLRDFSKPLTSEPVGRVNPFSPIGVENAGSVKLAPNTKTGTTSTSTVTGN